MCGMGIRMHILWALKAGFDSLCAAVHVKDFFSRLVGVVLYHPQDRMGRKVIVMGSKREENKTGSWFA